MGRAPQKVMVVIGTRPEAIKMAPVIRVLRERPEQFEPRVVLTGQHRELVYQVLELMDIRADEDLAIMKQGQTLSEVTCAALQGLERSIQRFAPDWVLVQGDTTTAMVGGLAAFYNRVLVGHVEAGLRTYDRRQPYPEEVNRRIIDVLADRCYAPTQRARDCLLAEGLDPSSVVVTGNTVIDALLDVAGREFDHADEALAAIPLWADRVVLITAHRRENFGAPLERIVRAIERLAARYPQVQFVYPAHPNPHVRSAIAGMHKIANVSLIEPLDYATLVHLMKRSELVLTDSGGIQEEAPSLGKPVLVLRETSERPEGIEAGVAKVVGTDTGAIVEATTQLLEDRAAYESMAHATNPYGDGRAAERIAADLVNARESQQQALTKP